MQPTRPCPWRALFPISTFAAALLAVPSVLPGGPGAALASQVVAAPLPPTQVRTPLPASPRAAPRAEPLAKGGDAAAAPADADPMGRLRERLAERLAGVKVTDTAAALDLRVATRPAPGGASASGPGRRAAKAGGSTRPRPGAKGGQTEAPHWDYHGTGGPQAWAGMRPEYALCGNGQRQSPIDLRDGIAVDLEPVRFDYRPSGFGVVDTGHTVQVNLAPGNAIEVGGKRFELRQFHFHRPSEERIDGRQFDMVAHLVHAAADGKLAVVAVLLDSGSTQPLVQTVWNHLPLEKHVETRARATLDPTALLPVDRRYYTYMGSLTTPPCSEGVQWVVLRSPVTVSPEQVETFSRLYPMNARPLQAAAGRRLLQSN